MAVVYPVILSKEANGYFVTIPDFDANVKRNWEIRRRLSILILKITERNMIIVQ